MRHYIIHFATWKQSSELRHLVPTASCLCEMMNSPHLFFQPFLLFPSFSRLAFLLLPFPLLLLLCSFHLSLKRFSLFGMTGLRITSHLSMQNFPMVVRTASISYQLFFFFLPLHFFNLLPAFGPLPCSGLHGFRETARGQHSLSVTHRVFKCARSMVMYGQAWFAFCTCSWKSQLIQMLMNKSMQVFCC